MLTINTLAATRLPSAEAMPATGPTTGSGAGADPAGFAALLRQNQAAPLAAPAAPPSAFEAPRDSSNETAAKDKSSGEAEAPHETEPATRGRPQLRFRPRAPEAPPPRRDAPTDAPPDDAPAVDRTGIAPETCEAPPLAATAPDSAVDAGLAQWLAGQWRPVDGAGDDAKRGADTARSTTGDEPGIDPETGAAGERGTARMRRTSQAAAETESKETAMQARAPRAEAAAATPFAGLLAEQRRAESASASPAAATDRNREATAVHAAALGSSPASDTAPVASTAVPIASPLDAPDFSRELGLRLAVLVKQGIQTAELHLNPAEMGPVSVQIAMDGTQARIDFGADLAVTRHAIEAGLPGLASALADAGFTLAGGGVSQHAGGQQGGREPGPVEHRRERRRVGDDEAQRVTVAARRIVDRGGIDVFA